MNVLVCGATGCLGHAVARALRSRGHRVIEASRAADDGPHALRLDFMQPRRPEAWAATLRERAIEAVVNCAGIARPGPGQRFAGVHAEGPIALFRGAALAGGCRVVQVSALGVDDDRGEPYLRSKRQADEALAGLPLRWAVMRPSLLYGPGCASTALFATLASLPWAALPGRGLQRMQPIHVYEVAEAIVRWLEDAAAPSSVHELGGGELLRYRDMLARYREALGLGPAWQLPMPMAAMRLGARLAEAWPQQVFCRSTVMLLERGSVAARNAAPALLGRAPSTMAHGLAVTPPLPAVELRVTLSPAVEGLLRGLLAFMWLYTAFVSVWWQDASGVMALLERCGFAGTAGTAAWVTSCVLNTALGVLLLARPSAPLYAAQAAAIVGYTTVAAWHMPELTIDHCGPLAKNLPVLGLVLLLALADGARRAPDRRPQPRPARAPQPASPEPGHCG